MKQKKKYYIIKNSLLDRIINGTIFIIGLICLIVLCGECESMKVFIVSKIIALLVLVINFVIYNKFESIRK